MRILGGLMALGYEIGTMLKRSSSVFSDEQLTIKLDDIEGMDKQFVQIQGKDRNQVAAAGKALGLDGTYIARSYIEQVRLYRHRTLQLAKLHCPSCPSAFCVQKWLPESGQGKQRGTDLKEIAWGDVPWACDIRSTALCVGWIS